MKRNKRIRKDTLKRPDLVVPYVKIPFRYRALPYLIFGGIIVITVIVIVLISVKGAS